MGRAAILGSLALTLAVSQQAQAANKTIERVKIIGETAAATWNYTQDNKTTFVNVIVTNNNVTFDGQKSQDAFVLVSINQVDATTGDPIVSGASTTTDFTFTIDHDLNQAAVTVPTMGFFNEVDATTFDLSVSLTWTGTGDITSQHVKEKVKEPGFKFQSHRKGDARDATASGSLFGNSTQFTPVDSESAQLSHSKEGSVTITTNF